jgi:hypothetical protein
MDDEIQLIANKDGISLIGHSKAIDSLLANVKLQSVPMDLDRLKPLVAGSSAAVQFGSEIAANSGRWVKLTKESAEVLKVSQMMNGSTENVIRGIAMSKGKISGILEFIKPGKLLTNPAVLSGVGGMMAQYAMQQTMAEITDYLKRIEEKLSDVVRALKDAQIAPMLAAGDIIEDVMEVRNSVGRVSETSWSKVQSQSTALATAQNYALLQIEGLSKKLAAEKDVGDAANLASEMEVEVTEWLVVIARSLRLHDAVGVIELERVFDSRPNELDQHRDGLRTARERRFLKVQSAMTAFSDQLRLAVERANKEVVWHPKKSPQLINSSTAIAHTVAEFQKILGVEATTQVFETRLWKAGALTMRDEALEKAAEVADKAKKFADETADNAKKLAVEAAIQVAERAKKMKNLFGDSNKSED